MHDKQPKLTEKEESVLVEVVNQIVEGFRADGRIVQVHLTEASGRIVRPANAVRKKGKKQCQPQGICIYCGGPKLSKQHVFADWLKDVVPRTHCHSNFTLKAQMDRTSGREILQVTPNFKMKQGDLGTRQIRKVCEACNSGWLSELETSAIPILSPLIKGEILGSDMIEQTSLGPNLSIFDLERQRILAAWAAQVTIMNEFTGFESVTISSRERAYLKDYGTPPPFWHIWLSTQKVTKMGLRSRHSFFKLTDALSPLVQTDRRAQHTTLEMGYLLFHIRSSECVDVDVEKRWPVHPNLVPIWPPRADLIVLGARPMLSADEVNAIANAT